MRMQFLSCAIGAAAMLAAPDSAFAAQACLANGKSYKVGEQACLTPAGESHLARCEMVLNNTSWTKIGDECPGEAPKPHPTSAPAPPPGATPTEPTEN